MAQSYENFEIIISDNASTDTTTQIIKDYANRDPRIHYIRQPQNQGLVWNFNFVLEQAQGDYFMWAATDDMWAPTWLEKCVIVLEENPDVSLVFSNEILFSHKTGFIKKYYNIPLVGTPALRLTTRFIHCCADLVHGISRINLCNKLLNINFCDVLFGHEMAVKGDIFILNDFLFYSGLKEEVYTPYPVPATSKKITYKPYYLAMYKLISDNFAGYNKILLLLLLLRQTYGFYRAYRHL